MALTCASFACHATYPHTSAEYLDKGWGYAYSGESFSESVSV